MQQRNGEPLVVSVDDEPFILDLLEHQLRKWGYAHEGVPDGSSLWSLLDQTTPSVILLDRYLDGDDGCEWVDRLVHRVPDVPVIVMTANGSVEAAVRCLRQGAYDFIRKPLDFDRLQIELSKAVERHRLARRLRNLEGGNGRESFYGLIGQSESMRRLYALIESVAPTGATCLIIGETGTGKELVARALHSKSRCARGPFVAVNAAAIPHELIESALFGHEKGAFTGAHQAHQGYCEQADGGTLFLDEICEMSIDVQAKLLRFLQDRCIQRVGGTRGREVDVRVIAATNRDPESLVREGRLREDLYYRLNVARLDLPPLRQRNGDVAVLAQHFLERSVGRYGRQFRRIAPDALAMLEAHPWPGNVRELENLVERVIVVSDGEELAAPLLAPMIGAQMSANGPGPIAPRVSGGELRQLPTMDQIEKELIERALELADGSVPRVADHIGISEATIYRKIKKYGLARPRSPRHGDGAGVAAGS